MEFSQPFFLGLTPPRRLRKGGWFPILSNSGNSLTWCYRVWKLDVWWCLIYGGFLEEISFTKSSYHPCNIDNFAFFPSLTSNSRDRDRYLEQMPFWFLPWGCSLFQVGHTQFEFPASFGRKMQKALCCYQDSNPRPSGCEPCMLPQDQRGFDSKDDQKLCT